MAPASQQQQSQLIVDPDALPVEGEEIRSQAESREDANLLVCKHISNELGPCIEYTLKPLLTCCQQKSMGYKPVGQSSHPY